MQTPAAPASDLPTSAIVTLLTLEDGSASLGVLAPDGRHVWAPLPAALSAALKQGGAPALQAHRPALLVRARTAAKAGPWRPSDTIIRRGLGLEGPGYGGTPAGQVTPGALRYFGMGHWGTDIGELAFGHDRERITAHRANSADGVVLTYEPGGFRVVGASLEEALDALAHRFADQPHLAGWPVDASVVAGFNTKVFLRLEESDMAIAPPNSPRTITMAGLDRLADELVQAAAEALRRQGGAYADITTSGLPRPAVQLRCSPWVCLEMAPVSDAQVGLYWRLVDRTWEVGPLPAGMVRETFEPLVCPSAREAAEHLADRFLALKKRRQQTLRFDLAPPVQEPRPDWLHRAIGWLRRALHRSHR